MREKKLEYYIACFNNLRRASRNGERAPHKLVVLLTVIHEVEQGNISSNFISLSSQFEDVFYEVWHKYIGVSANYNDVLDPGFFHLNSEPCWFLQPWVKGEELKHCADLKTLMRVYEGAIIDEELFTFLTIENSRKQLKDALIASISKNSSDNSNIDDIFKNLTFSVNTITKDFEYYVHLFDEIANKDKGSKYTIGKLVMLLSTIEYIQWRIQAYEDSTVIPLLATWEGIYLSNIGEYLNIKRNSTAFSVPFLLMDKEPFWHNVPAVDYIRPKNAHNYMTFTHLQDSYDGVEIELELMQQMTDIFSSEKLKRYIEGLLLMYKKKNN